jgi:hypothetical protein
VDFVLRGDVVGFAHRFPLSWKWPYRLLIHGPLGWSSPMDVDVGAFPIRIHDLVSHHIPELDDRSCGLSRRAQSVVGRTVSERFKRLARVFLAAVYNMSGGGRGPDVV